MPAGYINSTANDLSKYLRELMNSYNDKSGTLIKKSLTDELFRPNDQNDSRYTLGWVSTSYKGREIFFHDGLVQSYQSSMTLIPEMYNRIN